MRIQIVIYMASLLAGALGCAARDYRVDSQEKFDFINTLELKPGDTILLKRGMSFSGMLAPQGNGEEGAPIRIGAFGKGKRPRIDAKENHQAGLLLRDPSYWKVDGLKITNTTGLNNIIARVSKDVIYEHNVLANSSRRDTGHSIFCFNTSGIKIQYNEAYGNVGGDDNREGGGESDRGALRWTPKFGH